MRDPEIPNLLKRIVCMAGWYYGDISPENRRRPEWNYDRHQILFSFLLLVTVENQRVGHESNHPEADAEPEQDIHDRIHR